MENQKILDRRVKEFSNALSYYFRHNKLENIYSIDKFSVNRTPDKNDCEIIILEPDLKEKYLGTDDEKIKAIGNEYKLNVKFADFLYPKK